MRYDVVVVGGGSGGAVMAARLSEDPARSVVLLEAGSTEPSTEAPAGVTGPSVFAAIETPGRIWPSLLATRTAAQAPALYVRGRGLGGSSSVNAMVALRGLPGDYDGWAAAGAEGWAWADVEPWFDHVDRANPNECGSDVGDIGQALLTAARAAGHPACTDLRAPDLGAAPTRLTFVGGRRVSTNSAYLDSARARPNLEIRGDALVDRIVVEDGRAVGVLLADGTVVEAAEVVLSAGAIHSPAILLRSGLDRPGVGRNLAEHTLVGALLRRRRLAPEGGTVCGAVVRCSSGLGAAGDLQLLAFDTLGTTPEQRALGQITVSLMEPRSRGQVTLASTDPHVDPCVDFALLSDEVDLERAVIGLGFLRAVVEHEAVAAISEGVPLLDDQGTTFADLDDDGAARAWLLGHVQDYVHAAGTCRMGRPDDPLAVVDPECRYLGVTGLRVVDASVMPSVPRANTHLSTVMIAEKVAAAMAP
jgi:choline dehydrogenase-like flavoprotein